MTSYLELHLELERRRAAAKANGTAGPRVLVAGPTDTGKSSLCRLLANLLTRCGNSTTLVDLDIGQGEMSVPGCVSAVPIHRPLDIEVRTATEGPTSSIFALQGQCARLGPGSGSVRSRADLPILSRLAPPAPRHNLTAWSCAMRSEGPRSCRRSFFGSGTPRPPIASATFAALQARLPPLWVSASSSTRTHASAV